jgi:hypothetical protein
VRFAGCGQAERRWSLIQATRRRCSAIPAVQIIQLVEHPRRRALTSIDFARRTYVVHPGRCLLIHRNLAYHAPGRSLPSNAHAAAA